MDSRPLLSGRGWRIAGGLVTALFLIFTVYALVTLVSAVVGGGA